MSSKITIDQYAVNAWRSPKRILHKRVVSCFIFVDRKKIVPALSESADPNSARIECSESR